jgi:hypothetical protein
VSINLLQYPAIAPEKPKFGEPCNGCGYCCAAETCDLAREFMGNPPAPCPAMEFEAGRFWCGLARTPSKYIGFDKRTDASVAPLIADALGFGRGCDAVDFDSSPAPQGAGHE